VMCLKAVSMRERGAEENVWSEEGRSDARVQKTT
jgi:hypothetical protein